MKSRGGFTLIEMIAVMGIMTMFLSVTYIRFGMFQKTTDLQSAANLVGQAITEVREKARNPEYSGVITNINNVNGYGIYFENDHSFFVYEDVKDTAHSGREFHWEEPDSDPITPDDRKIKSYNFEDSGIKLSKISSISSDYTTQSPDLGWTSEVGKSDIFITYDEVLTSQIPYYSNLDLPDVGPPNSKIKIQVDEVKIVLSLKADISERIGVKYSGKEMIHEIQICKNGDVNCDVATWGL